MIATAVNGNTSRAHRRFRPRRNAAERPLAGGPVRGSQRDVCPPIPVSMARRDVAERENQSAHRSCRGRLADAKQNSPLNFYPSAALMRRFSAVDVLNIKTRRGGIGTSFPVFGLRPIRSFFLPAPKNYHRLPQRPLNPPPRVTKRRIRRSTTAPMKAFIIRATMPTPRWIPN